MIKKVDERKIELDVGIGSVSFHRSAIKSIELSTNNEAKLIRKQWNPPEEALPEVLLLIS